MAMDWNTRTLLAALVDLNGSLCSKNGYIFLNTLVNSAGNGMNQFGNGQMDISFLGAASTLLQYMPSLNPKSRYIFQVVVDFEDVKSVASMNAVMELLRGLTGDGKLKVLRSSLGIQGVINIAKTIHAHDDKVVYLHIIEKQLLAIRNGDVNMYIQSDIKNLREIEVVKDPKVPTVDYVIVACGSNSQQVQSMLHYFYSQANVALVKLNQLSPLLLRNLGSLKLNQVMRVLVLDDIFDENASVYKSVLEAMYAEGDAEMIPQMFSVKWNCLEATEEKASQLLETFLSPEPNFDELNNDDLRRFKVDNAWKAKNDLMTQVVFLSSDKKDVEHDFLEGILAGKLKLQFESFTSVAGDDEKLYQKTVVFGPAATSTPLTFAVSKPDIIVICDSQLLYSSAAAKQHLSHLMSGNDNIKVVVNNSEWHSVHSEKEVLSNLPNDFKAVLSSGNATLFPVNFDMFAALGVVVMKVADSGYGYNFNQAYDHLPAEMKDLVPMDIAIVPIDFSTKSFRFESPVVYDEIPLKFSQLSDDMKYSLMDESRDDLHRKALNKCMNGYSSAVKFLDCKDFGPDCKLAHLYGKLLSLINSADSEKTTYWLVSDASESNNESDQLISSVHSLMANDSLSQKANINVLLLFNDVSTSRLTKDIGLFCMHYGNAYVASISAAKSVTQSLQAYNEAVHFNGVSILLASSSSDKTWPLYRWNPALEDADEKFKLDSDEIREEIKAFLEADQHLTLLAKQQFSLPKEFNQSMEVKYLNAEAKLQQQYEKLQQTLGIPSTETKDIESQTSFEEEGKEDIVMLILYGSDSGNGQGVAEKLAKKAKLANDTPGFNRLAKIRCCEANEYAEIEKLIEFDFEDPSLEEPGSDDNGSSKMKKTKVSIFESDATEEDIVDQKQKDHHENKNECLPKGGDLKKKSLVIVLVLSTAGQGEPTGDAKNFTENLFGYKKPHGMKSINFAVFGLGDSSYWGKGTVDSAKYFCKISRDVDHHLLSCGAQQVCPIQLGDDQDDDGYNTKLELFEKDFWLGVKLNVPMKVGSDAPPIIDDDLKIASNFLRGTIDDGLNDLTTLKILPEDAKLTKFHGIYQQDLRTVREELDEKHLERAYSFMIRIGIPGGVCGVGQLLKMMDICDQYANKKLKLTTRQAFQVHGVVKKDLKITMQAINRACMDTLAACGDVNRNVIANPHLHSSEAHFLTNKLAIDLNVHLKPRTSAYHEIWLDKKKLVNSQNDFEPIYGKTYLPRKFKIALAVPPINDVDVFSHCLGYVAVVDQKSGKLLGFNISVGGGMGTTHNNEKTYPKLAPLLGFVKYNRTSVDLNEADLSDFIKVAEAVVILQRDHGERTDRKHARLKYTVEDLGIDFFRENVERISGVKIEAAKPFKFTQNSDEYGWRRNAITGKWSFTMFVENGVIWDTDAVPMKTGLRHLAEYLYKIIDSEILDIDPLKRISLVTGVPNFSMTANQHLILGEISDELKPSVEDLLFKYKLDNSRYSNVRLHSMACVALPTCALAMAEAQTYLPLLITKVEGLLEKHDLLREDDGKIVIRMTGCPNGCARPYMAEIGLVGKAPGQYNLLLGGGYAGNRLNKLYKEGIDETEILFTLDDLFGKYSKGRYTKEERFGDWCIRSGIIEPTLDGKYFWKKGAENLIHDKVQVYW